MFPAKFDSDAVIVAACRTPIGKVSKNGGALSKVRPEDLGAIVVKELLRRLPEEFNPFEIDDMIFGCAFPEAQQGMNIARIIPLLAELPVTVPGMTINRFCSSGLQAISLGADRIRGGDVDIIIAGGVESMSMVPMMGNNYSPHPALLDETRAYKTYISMIDGAELLRKGYVISRQEQDKFALGSHQRAISAQDAGRFTKEIIPIKIKIPIEMVVNVTSRIINPSRETKEIIIDQDEGLRRNTSLEKLAKLEPVNLKSDPEATITAGNASQMSDGAAGVVIMSRRKAKELGIKPLARLVCYAVSAINPEYYGIGPVYAVRKVLRRVGMRLCCIDLIELNEAFAVQALAVIRDLSLNQDILNVNGGAIALGHPLGCSGARIAVTLIHEMRRRGAEFGLETMCVGGGMGAAGIFQLEN